MSDIDTNGKLTWTKLKLVSPYYKIESPCQNFEFRYVPRWRLSLSWPIQSDHLLITDRMIPPLGWEHSHGKTQYIPGKQVLVWKIYYKSNQDSHLTLFNFSCFKMLVQISIMQCDFYSKRELLIAIRHGIKNVLFSFVFVQYPQDWSFQLISASSSVYQ